ncbi:MAG TPA: alcohol dehydrogenase catalytic domain-containing protein, partial [Candidatus Limnocylindrales bacterium]|nr:alcohol dehydrogenase catalytic domain-containing protein [Candidatus Limnocylindrales bacterium]
DGGGRSLMLAAVFEGDGRWSLADRPEPCVARPDDVLVEVEACGICGTDLQILNVPPGHPATPGTILGHELVGRVVEAGDGAGELAGLRPGVRVVVDPDPKCGVCRNCRAGRPASCVNIRALGIFRDGGLAKRMVAPAAAVYPIDEAVPSEVAAVVEPLACVVNGANKANLRPGESVLVFGAGPIGSLFVALFRAAGASPIVVVEPSTKRHAVVRAAGADVVVTPDELAARRAEIFPFGAEVVVDAVGTQFGSAVEAAALGGRIVLFGQNANARPPIHQYTITERSLSVLGTYITAFTFPTAIRLAEQGNLPLAAIVTHVLPLDRLAEGFDLLRSGDATKVVITP